MTLRNINGESNVVTSLKSELRKVNNINKNHQKENHQKEERRRIDNRLYLHLSYDWAPPEVLTSRSRLLVDSDVQFRS